MRSPFRLVLQICLLVCGLSFAAAEPIFQDGFESGTLGSAWSVAVTNNGRATVTKDYAPATGNYHLVMDDSVNDAIYSVVQATLALDLSNRKNVVLTFKAKSLGNEPDAPPSGNFTGNAAFDGVSISTNGGNTWRAVQSLAAVPTTWQTYSVTLDSTVAALGGSFNSNVLIRFSEYDNSPAPIDGIAIDDVAVSADADLRIALDLPSSVTEGGPSATGYVLLSTAPSAPLTVNLAAKPSDALTLPATVVVPAGQTYASFNVAATDDNVVDFTRSVAVTASSAGYSAGTGVVTVYDNEKVNLKLTLPAQLAEGSYPSANASVSIDQAGTSNLTVALSANPSAELYLPSSVTIPAGSTSVVFTVYAYDDNRLDGNVNVTVTASADGLTPATAQTTTLDNEVRSLNLTFASSSVQEGGSTTGTVTIGGTLTTPLTVNLSSSSPSATVPGTVTIPAGTTSASFPITVPDNTARDGDRTVSVSASADTFPSMMLNLTVIDNEVSGYKITGLTDIVNVSVPVPLTITAANVSGDSLGGYNGAVSLFLVFPDGSTQPVSPASVTLTGTSGWTGSVTLPATGTLTPLRLRAKDATGLVSDSAAFDVLRVVSLTANDLLWDGQRGRLYASVSNTDTTGYVNSVATIDPAAAKIGGSVFTGNNPGQLALTSAGEQLYVVLNGNGSVSRITPDSLTVNSGFAVGTDSFYGTLYAEDIVPVAGQPNTLVLSRRSVSTSPRHVGVAVYDNGVPRSKTTQVHTGSNVIEPSADPTVYFGYNNESTEFGFRQLKLDSTGLTETAVNTSLIGGFSSDMRSVGNSVFSNSGVKVDGAQLRRLGTFPVSGPVFPDLASNRVYFLEADGTYSSTYNKLGAYDPSLFVPLSRLTLPSSVSLSTVYGTSTNALVRWGTNGLAVRTGNAILLINSSRLVPNDPPANLAVTTQATPNPASVGFPLTYTVSVTNQGPNIAHGTLLVATLSDGQTLTGASSGTAAPAVSGLTVSLPVGDLAPNTAATLTLTTSPQSAGSVSCQAGASSTAVDLDSSDNTAFKLVSVGFQPKVDVVNQLRLVANNLVADPTRALLWASVPATVDAPLGRSVVAINPLNGLVSDPIPLTGSPRAGCMALSTNGRYLYVGLTDAPEIARLDLSVSPPTILRIPLGLSQWNDANYALDIEPLIGDGTSFVVTGSSDNAAYVFDGTVRRANKTAIYTVTRVEKTSDPNTFVGFNTYSSSDDFSLLAVTPTGITTSKSVRSVVSGSEIRADGNTVLSSAGQLLDSSTLSLKTNLGVSGRPCLDLPNLRAYVVNGPYLYGFDSTTGQGTGKLPLPTTLTDDWAQNCVRYGLDGFAILGPDRIYLARWSATIPASIDSNNNGIADAWEATYFNSLNVSPYADSDGDGVANALEYLFNTPPTQVSASPLGLAGVSTDAKGRRVLRVTFPRRSGVAMPSYGYETSADLVHWQAAGSVVETVLSTQTTGGIAVDAVSADITLPDASSAFVRLRWLHP